MAFNIDKCKILHIGKDNPRFDYDMTDANGQTRKLKEVTSEKDLGIYIQNDLKFDQHLSHTVNRGNKLVGMIKRAFSFLNEETLLVLYKTLIRPIMDYGNTVWFPTLKKDIRAVENVQRRVTRILPELVDLGYEERLRKLKLTTLHYRRNRMDMIQVFKILNNFDDVPSHELFDLSTTQTRGHCMKLNKPRSSKTTRANSFCLRIINSWNNLPEEIVMSRTVLCFKTLYDRYMGDQKFDLNEIY